MDSGQIAFPRHQYTTFALEEKMAQEFKSEMNELLSSRLQVMKLAAYEDEEKAALEQLYLVELDKKKKAVKEQMYLMEFNKKKKDEIMPVMKKIRNYITSLGYPVEIEETDDVVSLDNRRIDASIVIRFMRVEDLRNPVYHNPFFSVTCDKGSQMVVLRQSILSSKKNKKSGNGPEERIPLTYVNQNLIQNKIHEVLKDIF